MISRPVPDTLKSIGTVIAPIALVVLTAAFFTGRGPAGADASTRYDQSPAQATITATAPPVTAREQLVQRRVETLRTQPFGIDPLLHEGARSTAGDQNSDGLADFIPEPPAPLHVNVQAIMTGSAGTIAVVDGRSYRVGDRLPGERWRIAAIDSDRRTVTFVDEGSGSVQDRVLTR